MTTIAASAVHDGVAEGCNVSDPTSTVSWDPTKRIALVRYASGARLTLSAGVLLVDALTGWTGDGVQPFAVLADGAGLRGTDAEYRAEVSAFFRRHRDTAYIALINLSPVIHIVVEMFRVGTGTQAKTFGGEAAARAWLRTKGIAA